MKSSDVPITHRPQQEPVLPPIVEFVRKLFVENVDGVYNVAYRVLWNKSDAEDVVQQSFIKAFTRMDQLHDQSRVRPWLLQIAYREAITVLRQRRDVTRPTFPSRCQQPTLPKTPPSCHRSRSFSVMHCWL